MSEQALQSVRQGVALVDERAYSEVYKQLRQSIEEYYALQARLASAWFAEHYPEIHVTVTPQMVPRSHESIRMYSYTNVHFHNPSDFKKSAYVICQELAQYLASLEIKPEPTTTDPLIALSSLSSLLP